MIQPFIQPQLEAQYVELARRQQSTKRKRQTRAANMWTTTVPPPPAYSSLPSSDRQRHMKARGQDGQDDSNSLTALRSRSGSVSRSMTSEDFEKDVNVLERKSEGEPPLLTIIITISPNSQQPD